MLDQIHEAIALYSQLIVAGCDVLIDRIEDPWDSCGQCYETSLEFIDWFRHNYWAEDTAIAHCWGLRLPLGLNTPYTGNKYEDDWGNEQRRNGLYHVVCRIGEYYIDLTGAQFGRKYDGAMIFTEESLLKMWWAVTEQISETVNQEQALAYA